jgi:predicted amidophosphoribosyltransferase
MIATTGRKLFGRWLSEAGRELVADADFLVPISLHRLTQSALLCAEPSSSTGMPPVPLTLIRTRKTEPQIGLASAQGIENVKRALRYRFAGGRGSGATACC